MLTERDLCRKRRLDEGLSDLPSYGPTALVLDCLLCLKFLTFLRGVSPDSHRQDLFSNHARVAGKMTDVILSARASAAKIAVHACAELPFSALNPRHRGTDLLHCGLSRFSTEEGDAMALKHPTYSTQ